MKTLADKKCAALRRGRAPADRGEGEGLARANCRRDGAFPRTSRPCSREYKFKRFPSDHEFLSAVAHIANTEDHHPDLQVGYGYCRITYTTHSIGGLSTNDFICAAKIDRL